MEVNDSFASMRISTDSGGRAPSHTSARVESAGPAPGMGFNAAFASMCISTGTGERASSSISPGVGATEPDRSNGQERRSSTCQAGHVEPADQAGTSPGQSVHAVIDIPAQGEICFGTGQVDSALLALRPDLNPGTPVVVQLTVTSSRLPGSNHDDLSAVYEKASVSGPDLRSASIRGTSGTIASGIIHALISDPAHPGRGVGGRNLVLLLSLCLKDIGVNSSSGIHPVRTIGQAMEGGHQLQAIQVLVFANCPARKEDVKPLAAALKNGNVVPLRVLTWDNSRYGSPESCTNVLLAGLASCRSGRPCVQDLTFYDGRSAVSSSRSGLKGALWACSGLRTLAFDFSGRPAAPMHDVKHAITKRRVRRLQVMSMTIVEPSSTAAKVEANIEWFTLYLRKQAPHIRLEVLNG